MRQAHHGHLVHFDVLNNNTYRLSYFAQRQLFHMILMRSVDEYDIEYHLSTAIYHLLLIVFFLHGPIHVQCYHDRLSDICYVNMLHRLNNQNEHVSFYNLNRLD